MLPLLTMIIVQCTNDPDEHLYCLEEAEMFAFKDVGIAGGESRTYKCFEKLSKHVSKKYMDSIFISKKASLITRAYAFWYLSKETESGDLLNLLKENLLHYEAVRVKSLDINYETTFSDLLIDIALKYLNKEDSSTLKKYVLSCELTRLNHYDSWSNREKLYPGKMYQL